MRSSTFCRAGRQRLTPLPTVSPRGASIFLAPKSCRSFQPKLASLSSPLVWRLESGGEPGLLPAVRVPGTSASSAGLGATPEGSPALSRGCRCRPCLVAVGQMGAHLPVLSPCLVRLLGGPAGGGPTLTALGEPHVPLLRHYLFTTLY